MFFRILLWLLLLTPAAWGQSSGGFATGQVLTAAELNAALALKSDYPLSAAILGNPNIWTAPQTFNAGINIAASGLNQALSIATQPAGAANSSQNCGGTALVGYYALNCINATAWNVNAGANLVSNFSVLTEVRGAAAQAGNAMYGFSSNIQFFLDAGVTSRSSYTALGGIADLQASPIATNFYMSGMNCNVGTAGGITWPTGAQMVCFEADNSTTTAGLAGRALFKAVLADAGSSNLQGSSFDALIYAQTVPGSAAFGLKNFVFVDGSFGKVIATNGCLWCLGGALTAATAIDVSPWNFTTAFKSNNFLVDGSGNGLFGLNSSPVAGAVLQVRVASNANLVASNNAGVLNLSAISNDGLTAEPLNISSSLVTFNGGSVAITPPVASATRGLLITQSGPVSGVITGNILYNVINITSDNSSPTGGVTTGLYTTLTTGGMNASGQKSAGRFNLVHNAASALGDDRIALSAQVTTSAIDMGTGGVYGFNAQAVALSGATGIGGMAGAEFDVRIDPGATALDRFGIGIVSTGAVVGSSLDSAIQIGSAVAGGSFVNALLLTSNVNGGGTLGALASTGCVICTDGVAQTLATVIGLPNWTISGNIFNFANFKVTGAGAITAIGLPSSAGAGGLYVCVDTSGVFYKKAACP